MGSNPTSLAIAKIRLDVHIPPMMDPKKLQDALDSAMADNVGGEFRMLITNLIEARSRNRAESSPNEQQSMIVFTNGVRMIWEAYLKASDIVAGIAKPAGS